MANVKEEVKNEAKIAEAAEEAKIVIPKIYVVRRKYTNKSDGKQYLEYILPAVFRGSVSKVHFKTSDAGGYEALDKLFSDGVKKSNCRRMRKNCTTNIRACASTWCTKRCTRTSSGSSGVIL